MQKSRRESVRLKNEIKMLDNQLKGNRSNQNQPSIKIDSISSNSSDRQGRRSYERERDSILKQSREDFTSDDESEGYSSHKSSSFKSGSSFQSDSSVSNEDEDKASGSQKNKSSHPHPEGPLENKDDKGLNK